MKLKEVKQTEETIFIDSLDNEGTILNSVEVNRKMYFKYHYSKQWGLSHSDDQEIVNFIKEKTTFKFSNLAENVSLVKKTRKGIYFKIKESLHYYYAEINSVVLCREVEPGKYFYNFGSNLNAPQEKEIIKHVLTL